MFCQTYPVHNYDTKPHLLTDYLFLAKEDGSKGNPWTRDLEAFKFFMAAAEEAFLLPSPYKGPDGKTLVDSYRLQPHIYDGRQKERDTIGE